MQHDNSHYHYLCYFTIVGLLGCFVPVVPGPPLAYIALLILTAFTDYKCSDEFLWQWAGIVVLVTIADFWLQIYGVKKFGGTKKAVNGTMIGLFVGIIAQFLWVLLLVLLLEH